MKSKFLHVVLVCMALVIMPFAVQADDYQLPDPGFEDWSGSAFDGNAQPKYWHGSNVEQTALGMSFKFNFTYKEAGHTGSALMVKDQVVGAAGITETGPGYASLGYAWQHLDGLNTGSATAGTYGGISFAHRPDTVSIWIKRTGNNTDKEDFHILFYSWAGTAKGSSYKSKSGGCTSWEVTDEESDIRVALDGNECKTVTAGTQIAEGWLRDRQYYGEWTNVRIPVYYLRDDAPEKCNLILSASNYPNFRANSGLYEGNALYVDDVELIYSSKIQTLRVGNTNWKGFDPNSTEEQIYYLPEDAKVVPDIEARRGAGSLTNAQGTTQAFNGRKLSGSEIQIVKGAVGEVTTITVKSEDGKSTTVYKIRFQAAASSNTKLANILYYYKDKDGKQQRASVPNFNPSQYNYDVELPYGTQKIDSVRWEKQEDEQKVVDSQPSSVTGKAELVVTAADGKTKATYKVQFSVGKLADNTLKNILVNGKSVTGFTPTQMVYKVSLPESTVTMPEVKGESAYPPGEQTIEYEAPSTIDGGTYKISVTTPGNQNAKVYKLNFKLEASSYSYLSNIELQGNQIKKCNPAKAGDETQIDFTPENMTYYVTLKMGTTKLPDVLYLKGDSYQDVKVTDLGGAVDGTYRLTVTAGNKSDQSVYKIVFSTEKSDISTLKGITIGGVPLEGFDPNVFNYTDTLPVGTTELPEIDYIKGDEYQHVDIAYGGVNGKTRITVTAGDGSMSIYQIAFSVATYSVNTLKGIYLDGNLIEGWDKETNEYWVNLDQGTTTLPVVTYEEEDKDFQKVTVRGLNDGVLNGDYKITVRPNSGASRTYIIHFSVATSSNTALKDLKVEGYSLQNSVGEDVAFDAEVTEYWVKLNEGESKIPAVSFAKAEDLQRVLSVLENKVQKITVTAESGAKREYTITFIVQVSQNAFLNMIYLDSVALPGFRKDSLSYKVELEARQICPVITVDKAAGQQVTITAPYAAGEATIKVQPEEGAVNTYTIVFSYATAASARLNGITIDGTPIATFNADKTSYEASYQGSLPVVEGVKLYEEQQVSVRWKDAVAWLYVTDTLGNKMTYNVSFSHIASPDNGLQGIYADGVLIDGFDAATLVYEYNLAAGSSYPEISYKAKDNTQVVFFGQVSKGKWAVTVQAEDKSMATYTVKYNVAKYNDATLKDLLINGTQIAGFDPTKLTYDVELENGAALPTLTVEAREGQTVMQTNVDANTQQVDVYAESGDHKTYTISYTRTLSNNANLADILIDGQSIAGFDPAVTSYIDTLAWRTKVIPNVWPVAALNNQTITTYYSRPNGVTKIHVVAENGAEKDYTIAFPVRKSNNTKLGGLILDSEDADINFKPTVTDYTVLLPFGSTASPKMIYEKDEPEQRIDIISRQIGDTSKIIVVAENGESQTYNVLFKIEPFKEANRLTMIRVQMDNDPELEQELSLKDKTKRAFDVNVPFGTRSLTIEYEKNYDAQTVFVEPGGVHNPTKITVKSNNDTVPDEIYTITPNMPTADPAVLMDIKVNGTTIDGFNSEQFSYIVNVTTKPVLRYTLNKGADINIIEQTSKHWKAEVSYGSRTNVYDVWYYYPAEQVPNAEFTEWTTAKYVSAVKPTGWNTVADALDEDVYLGIHYKPNNLIYNEDNERVDLHTRYSNPGGGDIPAFITLGNVTGSWGRFGATSLEITGGMSFHNSPDTMKINYKLDKVNDRNGDDNKHNLIQYRLAGMDGDTTLEWLNYTAADYQTYTYDLSAANAKAGAPTTLNLVLCSNYKTSGSNLGSDAQMRVDYVRFYYNHTLTGATVDGNAADMTGNAFSYTLSDPERIEKPVLAFAGEVNDQSQLVNWSAPMVDGDYSVRTATIRNFAENGTDYTDYTMEVKRPLDTKNTLDSLYINGVMFASFNSTKTDYTVNIGVQERIPDIQPFAASSLETITTAYDADAKKMTISVTSEKGETKEYTITFVPQISDDVTLKIITADGISYDKDTKSYNVIADRLPLISFEKQSDLQKVELINGVLNVTAEDGVTTGQYTITFTAPDVVPNGVITQFEYTDDTQIEGLGGATTSKSAAKPTGAILFTREQETDSVIFVQSETQMTWSVPETSKTYTWSYTTDKSTNASLANFTVNGVAYDAFNEKTLEYELISDTTIVLAPLAADSKQTMTTTYEAVDGGVEYATEVTPEDNTAPKKVYKIKVLRPMDSNASLAGILLNNVPLDNFHPDSLTYTVTLPVGAVKTTIPTMPSITYLAAHKGQKVQVTPGSLNADATILFVTSEDGNETRYYDLTINVAKSSCVDLTGITLNSKPVDQFEPGRHFYSQSVNSSDITIDYTSDDRFQTVNIEEKVIEAGHQVNYTLHVTAENGAKEEYVVDVYIENQSIDAELANITLNGQNFVDFERALNPKLAFQSDKPDYKINLPSGTTVLPEVKAQLKMDGQKVDIQKEADTISLVVTAADGVTTKTYKLAFEIPLSKNTDLSMIFLNGDSIKEFKPDNYFYQIELAPGIHEAPEVAVQKSEASQTVDDIEWNIDQTQAQATIKVHAEAGDAEARPSKYTVVFIFKKSEADMLKMIYQDGDSLKDFRPDSMYYTISLPVGTTAFPDLSWEEEDDLQTIKMDTVEYSADSTKLIRQIQVTAESGSKNTYTVSYTIEKSSIATLQMIFVDQKKIPEFDPNTFDYKYPLSAAEAQALNGTLPTIEYIQGDEYQSVMISQALEDSLDQKSLGYKSLITVKAASGNMNVYTVRYPVELSKDTTLNMINVGGKPLANFDSERFNYRLELELGASVPVISVIKKEDAQVFDIQVLAHDDTVKVVPDTVQVFVTAEDAAYTSTYTLIFERLKSKVTTLSEIILKDAKGETLPSTEFVFRKDKYEYTVNLEYNKDKEAVDQLPTREYTKSHEEQTIEETIIEQQNGDVLLEITVTAPNGEDQAVYSILFKFIKPSNAFLASLAIGGEAFADFKSNTTEYTYKHPYGTDPKDYFTPDDVTYELIDTLATVVMSMDADYTINVEVTAQDGVTKTVYRIKQITGDDNDNALAWITVNGVALKDFDPEVTFYTYYVYKTDNPMVDAGTRSEKAEYDVAPYAAGDTCVITCIAADNSTREYYIHFAITTINPGAAAAKGCVLVKRVPGTNQLFVASIRSGVDFALYDRNGIQLSYYTSIPTVAPNNVEVYTDSQDKEVLSNVTDYTDGIVVDVIPGEPLFYVFFSEGKKISEGRILFMQ